MTEDTEANVDSVDSQPSPDGTLQEDSDGRGATREQWESLGANPDNEADLGYDLGEWEQFQQPNDADGTMFLPEDEDHLKDEMFIVADASALATLENYR